MLATLATVAATPAPPDLPALESLEDELAGWSLVAEDPAPFLSLGLCSAAWLGAALPMLLATAGAASLAGESLLHLDVRSDNLCFVGEQVVLVDWNSACRGNARVDVAGWLPSLHAEGGPAPEAILPDEPELATLLSGYFASRAGLPPPASGSRVREVQRRQLGTALPWAVRALGLPPLDRPVD